MTGASGFIATHVVQLLLRQGYRVRGTVRNLKNEAKVKALYDLHPGAAHPLELVEADLLQPDTWDKYVLITCATCNLRAKITNRPIYNL